MNALSTGLRLEVRKPDKKSETLLEHIKITYMPVKAHLLLCWLHTRNVRQLSETSSTSVWPQRESDLFYHHPHQKPA